MANSPQHGRSGANHERPSSPDRRELRAAQDLLPAVYDELRRLARKRIARLEPGQTIQATALVHDAYLRLAGDHGRGWEGRTHFFRTAAQAMRQILVDRARKQGSQKHGGHGPRIDWTGVAEISGDGPVTDVLSMDEVLERLKAVDPRRAEIVTLLFYGGLTEQEAAESLEISLRTLQRDWRFARAWLTRELST